MFRINLRKLAHFWQKYIFAFLFPTKRTTRFKSNRRTIHLFTENQPEIIRAERWSKIHFKMSSQPLLTLISSRRSSSMKSKLTRAKSRELRHIVISLLSSSRRDPWFPYDAANIWIPLAVLQFDHSDHPSVGEETHRAQSRINRAAKLYRDAAAVRLEDDLYSTGFTIGSREWKRPPAWNDLCTCTSRDCTPHPLARLLFHRYCSTRFLFPTSSIMKENLIWKDRGPSSCLRDESSFSQSLFSFFFYFHCYIVS